MGFFAVIKPMAIKALRASHFRWLTVSTNALTVAKPALTVQLFSELDSPWSERVFCPLKVKKG